MSPESEMGNIAKHFSGVKDPRIDRTKRHRLLDIIIIAICGVICGADSWVDIELFGKTKIDRLKTFLRLPNGIPSHDTFGRVFAALNPEEFESSFMEWVQAINQLTQGQVIAIDGKQLRGSHDSGIGKNAIYMVSAWATENKLVLGQRKVDDKSNEITAIPKLLKLLEVKGCIVMVDAIGSQEGIPHSYAKMVNKDHGRIEIRQCWAISDPEYLANIRDLKRWEGIQTLVMILSERRIGDDSEVQDRYLISSLESNAEKILRAKRSYWGIENRLHWVLDIAFNEDRSRVRKDNAPQNFAVLRHMALNLLKQENTAKGGIKAKRLQCGWNVDYLLKVLGG